jgi:phosphoglycolate phosphatase-like HAD superfamily hydrolase
VESLALRLDREADLWRSVGLRELAQIGRTDRIGLVAAVVATLADLALAFVGGMTALFGAEGAVGRALLLLAAGFVATGGAAVVGLFTASNRKAQRARAAEALSRADLAELRLHRVGIALAVRKNDPAAYAAALERLERDAAG